MEEKRNGWTSGALQKCSRNDFVSKNSVFTFHSDKISIHSWFTYVWQEQKHFFTVLMFFFSVGEELTLYSLHGKIYFRAISSDTRGLFTGNFKLLSSLKFYLPFTKSFFFSFTCGLNIVGNAQFTLFFSPTQWQVDGNSKVLFRCEISSKDWSCTVKLIFVSLCKSLEIKVSTINRAADSEENRWVYFTEIVSNRATFREVNSTEID